MGLREDRYEEAVTRKRAAAKREMMAAQGLVPHKVVKFVSRDETLEGTALTAALNSVGADDVVYLPPDDKSHHNALISSILKAQMKAALDD